MTYMKQVYELKTFLPGKKALNSHCFCFDWLKLSHHLVSGESTLQAWSQRNLHYMRLHFLKLDREFFCLQPSLARLYSAAASPSFARMARWQ